MSGHPETEALFFQLRRQQKRVEAEAQKVFAAERYSDEWLRLQKNAGELEELVDELAEQLNGDDDREDTAQARAEREERANLEHSIQRLEDELHSVDFRSREYGRIKVELAHKRDRLARLAGDEP